MDMLVLERAPLGAIRTAIWTRRGAACVPEAPTFTCRVHPKSSGGVFERAPESCRVIFAFPAEMQTQKFKFYNRGRTLLAFAIYPPN